MIQHEIEHYESALDVREVGTVLEVGEIKRDISYLGDVLNTAARIQGKCNDYGEDLLGVAREEEGDGVVGRCSACRLRSAQASWYPAAEPVRLIGQARALG